MLRKILTVAILAGFCAGLIISVVQEFTTTPYILHAEEYENAGVNSFDGITNAKFIQASVILIDSGHGDGEAWGPSDGMERSIFTALSNVITGIGFALLLVAAFALYGRETSGRTGIIWGIAGFAAFALAPALGLAPELPGMMAADLVARQGWWIMTAIATVAGLALMAFGQSWVWRIVGIVALAAPHIIGAPHPESIGSAVPPELASHFVAASLVTAAVFWATLGWFAGTFWSRQS